VLASKGLGPPVLNALVPNEDNYTVLLMQTVRSNTGWCCRRSESELRLWRKSNLMHF
jgi:hypothetical protein